MPQRLMYSRKRDDELMIVDAKTIRHFIISAKVVLNAVSPVYVWFLSVLSMFSMGFLCVYFL